MDSTKPFWQSKTVWTSVLTVAMGVATAFGFFSEEQADTIIAEGPELLVGLITSALGVLSLYGRVVADKKVTVAKS